MSKLYSCDRCRTQVPDNDEQRVEWTHVNLCKVTTPTTPFQNADLCPTCTDGLRNFLANPAPVVPIFRGHKFVESTLGHSVFMCEFCKSTSSEIAVIGDLEYCPENPSNKGEARG